MSLLTLPLDLLRIEIMKFLGPKDLSNFAVVNKFCSNLCQDSDTWKFLIKRILSTDEYYPCFNTRIFYFQLNNLSLCPQGQKNICTLAEFLQPIAQILSNIYLLEAIIIENSFFYVTSCTYSCLLGVWVMDDGAKWIGFVIGSLNNTISINYNPGMLTGVILQQFLKLISDITEFNQSKLDVADIDRQICKILLEFVQPMERKNESTSLYKTDYCRCNLRVLEYE